ncbi:MAG: ThiF family adenylyltransferase [Vicinamibacterales bacterium]
MSKAPGFKVLFPLEAASRRATGTLWGYRHHETGVFNVTWCGQSPPTDSPSKAVTLLGVLHETAQGSDDDGLLSGFYVEDQLTFRCNGRDCEVHFYSLVQDVFSRNTGILETNILLNARTVISGCGSVGSQVALELARSGVGNFLLVDNDQLAYHNLCRHQCGLSDVGRLKVDAVRDRILDINPNATVDVASTIVERIEKKVWDAWLGPDTVVVGCADNREADLYANRLSQLYLAPFVSIGLWERAFAGELFWSVPGETPCYHCAFGAKSNNLSFRSSQDRRIYTTEEDLSKLTFEPGIAVDIGFVTNIGVKIALDLFARGRRPMRLLDALKQLTLVCNTTNVQVADELQEIFDHPLQVTRSIEVEKQLECPHCRVAGKERAK